LNERVIELAVGNLGRLPAQWVYENFGNAAPASVYDRMWLVTSLAQLGRFVEATPYETEAIRLAAPTQHAFTVGLAHYVGITLLLKGEWAKARSLLETGIAAVRSGSVISLLSRLISSSAWILARLGETKDAVNRLREGDELLELATTTGIIANAGWDYHALGQACLLLDRLDDARRYGELALKYSPAHPGFAAHAVHLLGDIETHPDRFDAEGGEAQYRRALALA